MKKRKVNALLAIVIKESSAVSFNGNCTSDTGVPGSISASSCCFFPHPATPTIIAVLALWSFVGMWNSYFDAMIYLNDANLQPLQLVLRSILVQNTPQPGMIADIQSTAEMAKVAEQLKYATIVVSSLPLLVMYPFFQKYFDEGIMVGSVKG